jgi:hypothetical protein
MLKVLLNGKYISGALQGGANPIATRRSKSNALSACFYTGIA